MPGSARPGAPGTSPLAAGSPVPAPRSPGTAPGAPARPSGPASGSGGPPAAQQPRQRPPGPPGTTKTAWGGCTPSRRPEPPGTAYSPSPRSARLGRGSPGSSAVPKWTPWGRAPETAAAAPGSRRRRPPGRCPGSPPPGAGRGWCWPGGGTAPGLPGLGSAPPAGSGRRVAGSGSPEGACRVSAYVSSRGSRRFGTSSHRRWVIRLDSRSASRSP